MDPLTAWALAIKAVAELLHEILRDQPKEMRLEGWQRIKEADEHWRKMFKPKP